MLTSAAVSGCPLHSQRSTPVMKRWPGHIPRFVSHRAIIILQRCAGNTSSGRWEAGGCAKEHQLHCGCLPKGLNSIHFISMLSDSIIKTTSEHFWNALIFTLQIKPNWGGPTESQDIMSWNGAWGYPGQLFKNHWESTNTVTFLGIDHLHLAVKEVGSHEKLKGNFRRNRELRDLGGGIGVPDMPLNSI